MTGGFRESAQKSQNGHGYQWFPAAYVKEEMSSEKNWPVSKHQWKGIEKSPKIQSLTPESKK